MIGDKLLTVSFNLIPYLSEGVYYLFFRSGSLGRIGKILMEPGGLSREIRAIFLGMIAHGNDIIERYLPIVIYMIGSVSRPSSAMVAMARGLTPCVWMPAL